MAPFGTRVSPSAHHVALITANAFFGMGAIVGKLGLPATHPLMFAFVREVVAGLLLLILAVYGMAQRPSLSTSTAHNQRPKQITKIGQDHLHPQQHSSNHVAILIRQAMWGWKVHWKSFAVLGLVVFGNQAGFIVGIKLTDPVTASVWQPSQPIMTAAICMAWGMEPVRKVRVMGVLLAALGCVAMVLLKNATSATTLSGSQQDDVDTTVSPTVGDESTTLHDTTAVSNGESPIDAGRYLIGNLLFFSNCLCTSLYVILSKRMLATYPAVLVTAWSYNAAAVCMWVALFMAASWPGGSNNFFCPECEHAIWYLPPAAFPALLYYILFASVASYGLITWANQFATGTLVMSYTVLQPVTTTLLTVCLLTMGIVQACVTPNESNTAVSPASSGACLEFPGWGTLCGMAGVFAGLSLIIQTEPISTGTSEKEKGHGIKVIPHNIKEEPAAELETVALVRDIA